MLIDKTKSRIIFSAIIIIAAMVLVGIFVPRLLRPKDRIPKIHYTLEKNGVIRFINSEEFLDSLLIEEAKPLPTGKHRLAAVGQIVLLIEPGSVATGGRAHPLHLDEKYSEKLGLGKLSWNTGDAFGIAEVPTEYKIRPGAPIEVLRYGLTGSASRAQVRKVFPNSEDPQTQIVVFQVAQGKDWYPGANCRIIFPTLSEKPVSIPKRALLHLGDKDYVFTEKRPGCIQIAHGQCVRRRRKKMSVTGLSKGERVLAKGSILLKNFIPELLQN
jgi:hypothetical protein